MDMGTSGLDTRTSKAAKNALVPNSVLRDLRKQRGWGRPRLARELHRFCLVKNWPSPAEANIEKQIYRLETGRVRLPDEFYTRLYCEFFGKTSDELFGFVRDDDVTATAHKLRSHKFIPLYVGAEGVARIRAACEMSPAASQWLECHRSPVPNYGDACHLYTWPFGVAMYHLVEELSPASIAEVAVWRHCSYLENMSWAEQQLHELADCKALSQLYVLGTYWVDALAADAARRDTLLRMLCVPKVLIERSEESHTPSQARAELVEQTLLRDGYHHPGIEDFGVQGVSVGLASWAGVVYQPLADDRALTEEDLVRCELAVQSAWSYCSYIRTAVENGNDPDVPDEFGWKFLRGLRSRLTTERPQETSQHRSLREAVVKTSGLSEHLTQALEIMREIPGGIR